PINVTEHTLVFNGVRGTARHEDAEFNFEIPSGAIVMAGASHHGVQRLFTNILKMHELPETGFATMGGVDFQDIEAHNLRKNVHVLDRPTFVGMTVREYLALSCKETASKRMVGALETVGLIDTISTFDDGLDTPVAATGWPLSSVELQQLKLANALLERPRILVLSRLFDLIDEDHLAAAINDLRQQSFSTVIYFSNRRIDLGFDSFLYLEAQRQRYFDNFDEFCLAANAKPPRNTQGPRPVQPKFGTVGQ
ncbi:MAG: ABC transporter ATP-binding protein, partial [Pseudomonadota bacterium]